VARHGAEDAAAGAGDLLVGGAFEAGLELRRAVAGVNEVGVAIEERRGDEAPFEAARLGAPMLGREVGGGAGPGDAVAFEEERGVGDEPGRVRAHGGEREVGEEQPCHAAPALRRCMVPTVPSPRVP
jgi:hypothetical protein